MRIKKIVSQNRRDILVIFYCEHCGHDYEGWAYDDSYFHRSVLPKEECPECGRTAGQNSQPRATKYPDEAVV